MAERIELLRTEAPELVASAEKARIALKEVDLMEHEAHVALCIDISGTMHSLFASGKIQAFAERILVMGSYFDQDAVIDIFLFGDEAYYAGQMNTHNFKGFIAEAWRKYITVYGTYYGKALKKIRQFYIPEHHGEAVSSVGEAAKEPIYAMFVTDGFTADEKETVEQLVWSSYEPIFWQFMAIGKSKDDFGGGGFWDWVNKPFAQDFSFLKKLDNLSNRLVDNANFFNVSKDLSIEDEELYRKMMVEYPMWLKEAKEKQIIR